MTDAPDGAAFRLPEKFLLAPREQVDQLGVVEALARREVVLGAELRELVPGAEQLAVVAAVDAVADGLAELERDRAGILDGEIGNAASRIEPVGRDDGLRGTDLHAAAARAAMGDFRFVGGQVEIGVQLAEEEPRARIAIDEIGVL